MWCGANVDESDLHSQDYEDLLWGSGYYFKSNTIFAISYLCAFISLEVDGFILTDEC